MAQHRPKKDRLQGTGCGITENRACALLKRTDDKGLALQRKDDTALVRHWDTRRVEQDDEARNGIKRDDKARPVLEQMITCAP